MALITDYATLLDLKSYLHIEDTADDAQLSIAVTGASRAIDQFAGRAFGQDASIKQRYYTYQSIRLRASEADLFKGLDSLEVDDISTLTGLLVKVDQNDDGVFETEYAIDTDFLVYPFNATADSRPHERIILKSGRSFPTAVRSIEISARFGWGSTPPDAIKQATLIQAGRLFKRREAPFGVAGSPETGSELRLLDRLDPDVAVLVKAYKREWGVV